jgi:translocator protein
MIEASSFWPVLGAAFVTFVAAGIGGYMTDTGPWYQALRKPAWKPPDWAFGPVWTVILILCIWSFAVGWREAPDASTQSWLVVLFLVNAVFHVGWNVVFFGLKRPDLAVYESVLLWLSILAPLLFLWQYTPKAALMLVPYLVWVAIATKLTADIAKLNPRARNA